MNRHELDGQPFWEIVILFNNQSIVTILAPVLIFEKISSNLSREWQFMQFVEEKDQSQRETKKIKKKINHDIISFKEVNLMNDSILQTNFYFGIFKDGVVLPDLPISLPNGTKVRIELIDREKVEEISCLIADLKALAGTAIDLPADLARNHDHYLHGTPKK